MPMLLVNRFADAIPALQAEERLAALDLAIAGHSVALEKDAFDAMRRELKRQAEADQPRLRPRAAKPEKLAEMGVGVRQTAATITDLDAWLGNSGDAK